MTLPPHLRPDGGKPRRGRPTYRDPTADRAVSMADKAPRRVPFSFTEEEVGGDVSGGSEQRRLGRMAENSVPFRYGD